MLSGPREPRSKSKRGLDSDQLGKKGEQRFGEICVDAGLIVNPASWDRKGWDFVVDWRADSDATNFDTRPTLHSCLVQVKTQWIGATAVMAPLGALEHIAKDVKPAFLYVIQVNDDGTYSGSYLAHLQGELLALILKYLREARVNRTKLTHKVRLPFAKWFSPLPTDGKALRTALEQAIGPSMGAYAADKQEQLNSLGFEAGRLQGTFQLRAKNRQEVVDAFLGLQPIEVLDVSAAETRFGISIPIPNFFPEGGGELRVLPRPFNRCTIIVRDPAEPRPFKFKAEMFGPPSQLLAPGELQTLFRAPLFDLRLSAEGIAPARMVNLSLTLNIDGERIRRSRVSAGDWRDFYGFVAASQDHEVTIEIQPRKGPGPLDGTIRLNTPKGEGNWAGAANLCRIAEEVFERAGWPGTKLAIDDISAAWERLNFLDALMSDPSILGPLRFTSANFEGLPTGERHRMLYIDGIKFGNVTIAYAVDCMMVASPREDEIDWASESLSLLMLRRIKSEKRAFDSFADAARRQASTSAISVVHDLELPS